MTTSERKGLLRAEIRARRSARSHAESLAVGAGLAVRLGSVAGIADLVADPGSGCVAAYSSTGTEPGTTAVRELLRISGVGVLLPVIGLQRSLGWAWDEGKLEVSEQSHGIAQPVGEIVGVGAAGVLALGVRVLLVPALAVDRAGRRLGQGGGFYDRVLADLGSSPGSRPVVCAVVHDDEVLDAPGVPVEPFDQRVDAVLTPSSYLDLR